MTEPTEAACLECGAKIPDPLAGACHECGAEDRWVGSQWLRMPTELRPLEATQPADSPTTGYLPGMAFGTGGTRLATQPEGRSTDRLRSALDDVAVWLGAEAEHPRPTPGPAMGLQAKIIHDVLAEAAQPADSLAVAARAAVEWLTMAQAAYHAAAQSFPNETRSTCEAGMCGDFRQHRDALTAALGRTPHD